MVEGACYCYLEVEGLRFVTNPKKVEKEIISMVCCFLLVLGEMGFPCSIWEHPRLGDLASDQ